jgi:hypothetical protein
VKIALIATQGVGKTTLAFELAARLKRLDRAVELVTEVARDCPLPINRDTTLDAQTWILHTQCAREIAAQAKAEIVVCDRSVLDNYAYLVHAVGRRHDLDEWVRRWCATYSAFFKVPTWRPPSFDGTRDLDATFQHEIDATIESLLDALGAHATRLDPQHSEEWTAQVLRALDLPLEPPQRELFGGA